MDPHSTGWAPWVQAARESGRRPRRTTAGELMVTPIRTGTVRYEGEALRMTPGITRLSFDHPLVAADPTAFKAADPRDRFTARELRSMVAARTRSRTRSGRRRSSSTLRPRPSSVVERPSWHLERSAPGSKGWRL